MKVGGAHTTLVKELRGVMAGRELTVTFAPKRGTALICRVELVAESQE